MVPDQVPSTSVLVDVVYVLGGDVVAANAGATIDPEMAERLIAAAALLGLAQRILHDIAESAVADGLPADQVSHLAIDARNAAGWISGDENGAEWLRAG